jgi:hypothetical protein
MVKERRRSRVMRHGEAKRDAVWTNEILVGDGPKSENDIGNSAAVRNGAEDGEDARWSNG